MCVCESGFHKFTNFDSISFTCYHSRLYTIQQHGHTAIWTSNDFAALRCNALEIFVPRSVIMMYYFDFEKIYLQNVSMWCTDYTVYWSIPASLLDLFHFIHYYLIGFAFMWYYFCFDFIIFLMRQKASDCCLRRNDEWKIFLWKFDFYFYLPADAGGLSFG